MTTTDLHHLLREGEIIAAAEMPLFRRAVSGEIRLKLIAQRWQRIDQPALKAETRPVCIMIGDQFPDGRSVGGPRFWNATRQIERLPVDAVILETRLQRQQDFEEACGIVLSHRRTAIIQTSDDRAIEWGIALRCKNVTILRGVTV